MTAVLTDVAPVLPRSAAVPDGVLVYEGDPHTDLWFAVRRSGITATDVPAIVGANDRSTALHVWLDKRGEKPADDGPSHYAEAGTRLEPMIARWWSDVHGVELAQTGIWANFEHPWRRCSPDRIVVTCPDSDGPCGLEVKNRNAYVAGKWRDDVPDDVLAQAAWTMAVTGWGHLHVAVLIGGNTPLWHRVDRDLVLEAYLVGEAERVWDAVRSGIPPEVDTSAALARLLDSLYEHRAGGRIVSQPDAADLYRRYRLANALEKRGKDMKAAIRDETVVALGDAEELFAEAGVKPLVTYRAGAPTFSIRSDDLRRLSRDHPDTYQSLTRDGYITKSTTRTMRWSKPVGESIVQD